MPEKSYREMNKRERRRYSLSARTARSVWINSIVLGLVALVIGVILYVVALGQQYIGLAFNLSRQTSISVNHANEGGAAELADEVMRIYRSLSPAEREKQGTAEYRALFKEVEESRAYETLNDILKDTLRRNDVYDVYLAMYDEKTCAMVYMVDPEEQDHLNPGEWESVTEKGMRKFLDWNGEGMLYDIDRTAKYGWLCTAGVPLTAEDGHVYAYLLADVSVDIILTKARSFVLQITLAMFIVTALIASIMVILIKKSLVKPINSITDAAQKYVMDKKAGVNDTAHFASLNIRTGDELENLSLVMADMEKDLAENEESLRKIEAEKERISTELNLATRIQTAMLPNIFPPYPERTEFEIYATMHPAREVGGDFYDFFLIDDDHLCLMIADVSGKGIPAALFMMISLTILKSCAMLGSSPAEILMRANQAICSNNPEGMFFTAWVGILELSTGKLTTANAGHEYPAIRRPDGSFELIKRKHGCVIGGFEDSIYEQFEFDLEPGTTLFVYTDGVPEAMQKDRSMYGTNRMVEALNRDPGAVPKALLENVLSDVAAFADGAEQSDDITMLGIRYAGPDGKGSRGTPE